MARAGAAVGIALALALAGGALPVLGGVAAAARPGGPATAGDGGHVTAQSLRAEAAAISAAMDSRGALLDELSQRYDAAVIRRASVLAAVRANQRSLDTTDHRVAAAHRTLVAEAVAAYIAGAQTVPVPAPGEAGLDPTLTAGYATAIGRTEHQVISAYVSLSHRQAAEQTHLRAEQRTADAALASLRSDRSQAATAQAADVAVLDRVKGRLATLVAADQARAAAQAARSEQAVLTSQGQSLPPGSAGTSTTATPPAPPTPAVVTEGSGQGGATTTTPPATAAPATTATTTPGTAAPPTTAAPSTTTPPTTAPPTTTPPSGIPAQAPGASKVLAYARAQLGKPYVFGGAGPDSFDCSGLVMRAWETAGIDFPHYAQYQYDDTTRIPLRDLLPGDLVFFGTGPTGVGHVGIYVGGGEMIDAPDTGLKVRMESIYWTDLVGGGRVTANS